MPKPSLVRCGGQLLDLSTPKVMGILNLTPDSFYDGGRLRSEKELLTQAEEMLREGAAILDIGGMSSRPGAEPVSVEDEKRRVLPGIRAIMREFPNTLLSIDTVWSEVARTAVGEGATIVNDISAGRLDGQMYSTVAELGVAYVLMHMKGTPETMQDEPTYDNPVVEILDFLVKETGRLQDLGVKDIILDPGFGFGKTIAHNYEILARMGEFGILDRVLLAGLSRKSMIYKHLGTSADEALNGTTAVHMIALQQGASILRVHDVREAVECVRIWERVAAVLRSNHIHS